MSSVSARIQRENSISSAFLLVVVLLCVCVTQLVGSRETAADQQQQAPQNETVYHLVYGSMLARNISCSVDDVENKEGRLFDFVKKYLSARFVEDTYEHIAVKSFSKQRLYHTINGTNPAKVTYLTEEAGYLQRITREIVLGTTYSVSGGLIGNRTPCTPSLSSFSKCPSPLAHFFSFHNLTITLVKNGGLFVFSHIWTHKTERYSWDSPFSGCHGNTFTIATQNIWNFNQLQPYLERMSNLGKVLVQEAPDVLALQEVRLDVRRQSVGMSQVDHILKFFKDYQYVFQPAMLDSNKAFVRIEEGVAILSKYPIVWWTYVMLLRNETDPDDIHQRILLHAVVNTPQLGITHVFTTHLSLGVQARLRSVVEICQYMSKFSGPKFLLGDFNTIPDSDEMTYLRGEIPLNGTYCKGYTDVWREGPQYSNTSATPPQRAGLTFNAAAELTKRIDYIYASSSPVDRSKSINILNAKTFGSSSYWPASDHLGVLLTVTC